MLLSLFSEGLKNKTLYNKDIDKKKNILQAIGVDTGVMSNIEILDLKDYPNGSRYFNNIDLIYKDYKPKIIHNNYIIGTQNKIDRFYKCSGYNLELTDK